MKVGDYCRTDKGKIGKIVHFEPRDKYPYSYDRVILDTEGYKRTTRNIIKCSEEIIDLIEAGDYVNGYKVEKVEKVKNKELGKKVVLDTNFIIAYDYDTDYIYNKNIKSIVTKECFENMEYKVKE